MAGNKRIVMIGLYAIFVGVKAQQTYTLEESESEMKIHGTSNLHDWTMDVEYLSCTMTVSRDEEAMRIQAVDLAAASKSIKSESSIMDNKTYDALSANTYPAVTFQTSKPVIVESDDNRFKGALQGELFIAGEASRISVPFTGEMITGERIRVSGSKGLNMTNFDVDPPTALLGTLKTGDEISVSFNLVFQIDPVSRAD